jgi:putative transposase
MSVLRSVKKGKRKTKVLGEADAISYEQFAKMQLDGKAELIRALIPLGLMHVQELLDTEVVALAGERYARKGDDQNIYRHGANPGSVRIAGQRHPVTVPRLRDEEGEVALPSWNALGGTGTIDDQLFKRVLYGISCRNYEEAAGAVPGAIGLSSSTVSRNFIKASAAKLRAFQDRDLHDEDIVALFLDGKAFAKSMMVVALGVTITGEKKFLGFVETDTENQAVLTPFLRSLVDRGLCTSQGLLVVIDGAKGMISATKKAFGDKALIQRCQWHKRENVVSYLPKNQQKLWRGRLQRAYERPTENEARSALMKLLGELDEQNQSAAASLKEGLEETLTLHHLGVYGVLGRSLKTTNCLESVNSQVEDRCKKVDNWKNSNQRQRWLAAALIDIEPRLHRIKGYRHLSMLREALMRELKIEKIPPAVEEVA